MDQSNRKDIFISYRNDGSGNQFASRLCTDLENMGYSVFFNPNSERSQSFPERLKQGVSQCKDFVLVLSSGCLEKLKHGDESTVDWVKEELLTAWREKKHIIPILMDGVDMPSDPKELPADLDFLPYVDAIRFPEQYLRSPFSELTGSLLSKRDGRDLYKTAFNSNEQYDLSADLTQLLERAENGDVRAMYEAGLFYYYGATNSEGTASNWDYEKAVYWLKKVIDSGDDMKYHAHNILARLYYLGAMPGEPQSYEKSYQHHVEAAPQSPYSSSQQAFMMRIGLGCDFDYQRILDFYEKNANQNDVMMLSELANFLTKHGRYAEAMDVYESLPNLTPTIQYRMGLLYRDGVIYDPPEPDYLQAAYYFREAADSGHVDAAYEYGLICFRPTGRFRKNFRSAEKYLKMAADNGHSGAQYVLGFMYKGGHVKKDYPLAVEYFEKARAQSYSLAALELACLYQQEECLNYQRAYECAQMAADHGLPEGEFILGNLLFWGRGCKPDMAKAYEMYRRSYSRGFYDAKIMMEKIEALKGWK